MSRNQPIALSVLIPAVDETFSLEQTVDVLMQENAPHIKEIWLVLGKITTEACRATAAKLATKYKDVIRIGEQVRPRLGGALRDAFEWAEGTHVVMMAADLETPPDAVKDMVRAAQQGADIVTATRWRHGGRFEQGYARHKWLLNWTFQAIFSRLYGTHLSDLTYGFRLFRRTWVKDVNFFEVGHPFLVETLVTPLRLGAKVVEIPCTWSMRQEGKSNSSFKETWAYVPVVLRTRFAARSSLTRPGVAS